MKDLIRFTISLQRVRGLGQWASTVDSVRSAQLKTQRKKPSQGRSLLSEKDETSHLGESAAVHFALMSLLSFGDKSEKSDHDPAVASTMEILSVVGSDAPTIKQEKEARSSGGSLSR
jgi:hypothetical protein